MRDIDMLELCEKLRMWAAEFLHANVPLQELAA